MKIESKPKKVKEYMIKIKLSEEEAKLLSGIEFKLKDVPTTYSHTWFSQMPFGSSVKADMKFHTAKQAMLLGELLSRIGAMIHED